MSIDIFGLTIGLPDLFWTVINFFILLLVLNMFLFKPVLKHMRARDAKISRAIESGKQADIELENARNASHQEILETGIQARQFVSEAHTKALNEKAKTVSEAEKEAHQIRTDLLDKISSEKEEHLREVSENMENYVTLLTNRLLHSDAGFRHSELIKKIVNTSKE